MAEHPEWRLHVETDDHGQIRFHSSQHHERSLWFTPTRAMGWLDVFAQGFGAGLLWSQR